MGKGKGATRALARCAAAPEALFPAPHQVTDALRFRALTGQSIPSFELHSYLSKKECVPPPPARHLNPSSPRPCPSPTNLPLRLAYPPTPAPVWAQP